MVALLADVGGTKTQLALRDENGKIIQPAYYKNAQFDDFVPLVEAYFSEHLVGNIVGQKAINRAVIAVAGPVKNGEVCTMTNLNWHIDGRELANKFSLDKASLLNDLQASAWGFTDESIKDNLTILRGNGIDFTQPVAVISPGTGLGQACIFPHADTFVIHPTEGGHKTVAPFNSTVAQLIQQHWIQHNQPVSWENWFSGSGLHRLYGALYPDQRAPDNEEMTRLALSDPDSPSGKCLTLFCQGIFSEAGNLALQYLSWGGVILGGGIPPKLKAFFQKPENIAYFQRKNEYLDLLEKVPIALCEQQDLPLRGAAIYSQLT